MTASLILAALALQSPEKLPPAGPIPAPQFEEAAVLAPIYEAFRAFEAQDSAAVLRLVYPDGRVTAVGTLASGFSGVRRSSWAEWVARMKPGNGFKESITNPAVEIDGDVALVWAPFTIEQGGKVVACGYDHFDMVRQDGAWKVMNVTFSSRVTGCPGQ
ncbi:nuclear transport factor 2 family protein [Sphingomonas jaspsi]|uniref:nuclear transport factor 2 family protein n=1 Tax=Sphingomonas jaspsi TaxID=392409 RepID=UPI0004B4DF24|nr:nuclear transport factor 2 family protein [Sphingomonas jaspsi]